MHFLSPGLLFGLGAVLLPLLIHRLLRPRPRLVRFPALKLMQPALASGQRSERLRNLWLLLIRTLLVACAALLLAGPTCDATQQTPFRHGPVAAVIVVDDSWSTRYALDADTTTYDRARRAALEYVRRADRWPAPSVLGILFAGAPLEAIRPTSDFLLVRNRLRTMNEPSAHAATLAAAFRQAAAWLQATRPQDRRLVVFTDLAAHAWRDVDAGILAGVAGLGARIVNLAAARRTNLALTAAEGPARIHPASMSIPLRITLLSSGLGTECRLVARSAGRVLERVGPFTLAADQPRDVNLLLDPMPRGVHGVSLEIEPDDRLPFDQARYVVFETGRKPAAWLVAEAGPGTDDDLTALLFRNLLAPELLPSEQQVVAFSTVSPREIPSPGSATRGPRDARPDLIVLISNTELNDVARSSLRGWVERGAILLLVPRSDPRACDWPGFRRAFSSAAPAVESLPAVDNLRWASGSKHAGSNDAVHEMTRCAVRRRVVMTATEPGVTVHAVYGDGAPALLSVRSGKGEIYALTTSPDPVWSELGVRAAGLLSWLHVLLRAGLGESRTVAEFVVGEEPRHAFAKLPRRGAMRVRHVVSASLDDAADEVVRVANGEPTEPWPTGRSGVFEVRRSSAADPEWIYAVNWPAAESRLDPIGLDRIRSLLGVDDVELLNADHRAEASASAERLWWRRMRGPADWLALALLSLLLAESLMAVRRHDSAGRWALEKKKPRAGSAADAGS